jgi:hypothetical protein
LRKKFCEFPPWQLIIGALVAVGLQKQMKSLELPKIESKCLSGVNFINVKRTNFSYECRFGSFSLFTCLVTFCFGKKFVQKTRAYNVDEIDTWQLIKLVLSGE